MNVCSDRANDCIESWLFHIRNFFSTMSVLQYYVIEMLLEWTKGRLH